MEDKRVTAEQILADAKNVFVHIKESGESFDFDIKQTELYKRAQDIEKKSRDFYLDKADEVQEKYQKEVFLRLADEEKKHYFLLVRFSHLLCGEKAIGNGFN